MQRAPLDLNVPATLPERAREPLTRVKKGVHGSSHMRQTGEVVGQLQLHERPSLSAGNRIERSAQIPSISLLCRFRLARVETW
jgi:hypothetical protein